MRRTIAVLVVVGLAIAVVLLLINRDDATTPDTLAEGTTTTTSTPASTTIPASTTSTTMGGTTTNPTEIRVVETVEEAEAILRELWFGWFEGIYNEDEERIREVVATEQMLNAGINAFGQLEFDKSPKPSEIRFSDTEILLSSEDCLAIWAVTEASFLDAGPRSGVDILRRKDGDWRFASSWQLREDLWEADCEAELLPLP